MIEKVNPKHPDKKITLEQIMTQSSSITDGFDDPHKGYDAVNSESLIFCINTCMNRQEAL